MIWRNDEVFVLFFKVEFYRARLPFFVSSQEQNTAVDGWNEQISQLTAECDQLKDSLQEVTKVSFLLFLIVALFNLQTSNLVEIV